MIRFLFTLILLCSVLNAFAADERTFRKAFSGELAKEKEPPKKGYKWKVASPFYSIDLTEDDIEESIGFEKKDGEDWVHFLDMFKKPSKSFQLFPLGQGSKLYKVSLRRLSKKSKVLILYYYEGSNESVDFTSTARLYFVTIDNNQLRTMKIFKGPYFLYEKDEHPEHYHRRKFEVGLYDYNKDGIQEIFVKYSKISRIYAYLGKGKWAQK